MKSRIYIHSLIKILASLLILLTIPSLINICKKNINISSHITSNPSQESVATKLNHANTYYWWGRYKKNTLPEFEKCSTLCKEIIDEIALQQTDGIYFRR